MQEASETIKAECAHCGRMVTRETADRFTLAWGVRTAAVDEWKPTAFRPEVVCHGPDGAACFEAHAAALRADGAAMVGDASLSTMGPEATHRILSAYWWAPEDWPRVEALESPPWETPGAELFN